MTAVLLALALSSPNPSNEEPVLVGWASLPADTFVPGPTSGSAIEGANDRRPPFSERQPVQGFSSLIRTRDGRLLVLSDNGFGSRANSPDAVLRFTEVVPDFRTARGGAGTVRLGRSVPLRDPDRRIPWAITADLPRYPGSSLAVDPEIRRNRLLTGADFDPESFVEAPDGSLWVGDEFGPYLLRFDSTGRLLDRPVGLPGVAAPENRERKGEPNLGSSKGLEGLALTADGKRLLAMLEGPLAEEEDKRALLVFEFDLERRAFTDKRWRYRLADPGHAIGEITTVDDSRYLVVERDGLQGAEARFKKIFLVDLDRTDADGFVAKTELVDLLDLADPDRIGGAGLRFRYPFVTIEAVLLVDDRTLMVVNDNNYPFSSGRRPGQPDDSEFLLIRLPRSLSELDRERESVIME